MEKPPRENFQNRNLLVALLLAVGAFLVGILIRKRSKRTDAGVSRPVNQRLLRKVQGLSEEQAEARKEPGIDNTLSLKPVRSRQQIWRENVLSIFNLSLIGLALVQLLFGKPLDALLSMGVLGLNIGVNIFQEYFARMRVKDLLQETRPRVTVIRDQATRSIDADNMVVGDMVAIGPGDELLADGVIIHQKNAVIDETMIGAGRQKSIKNKGDRVFAGSFCVAGHAVFQVEKIGTERYIQELMVHSNGTREQLTPIEKIINSVLRVLLVIVGFFALLLVYTYFNVQLDISVDFFNEIAGMIFSIAPAGLFFMVIVTYAASTVDLAKVGALVHRARSVEAMAQVNTICFSREGVLLGTKIDLSLLSQSGAETTLNQNRVQQILGDYVRSSGVNNQITQVLKENFEGSQRLTMDEAPFLSIYGWEAINFDDPDLAGTYVLGIPAALEPYLQKEETTGTNPLDKEPTQVRKIASRLGNFFRWREKDQSLENEGTGEGGSRAPTQNQDGLETDSDQVSNHQPEETDSTEPGLFRRLLQRVSQVSQSLVDPGHEQEITEEDSAPPIELVFAYFPEPAPLYNEQGKPQFPIPLTPLCKLTLTEQVRPEAVPVIKNFYEQGIGVKIFAAEQRHQIINLLRSAGLGDEQVNSISGDELAEMGGSEFSQAAADHGIFLNLSPSQMGQIVAALKGRGQYVAMIGDSVSDVPALRQADLAGTYKSSSLAAQSVADILLLENSLGVLERVLDKGQRIVNGLLDILKLYLTQVFYLSFLIAAIQLIGFGFPIRGIQLTVVTTATITLPSLGLTLWAAPGVLYGKSLRKSLFYFVFPAASTIAIAGTVIFFYFLALNIQRDYAHLATTYYLVFIGLLVVLFLKPPFRIIAGGAVLSRDRRVFYMVLGLGILFLITVALSAAFPFLYNLLSLDWLDRAQDYLVIGMVVVLWAGALQVIWRVWNLIVLRREFSAASAGKRVASDPELISQPISTTR